MKQIQGKIYIIGAGFAGKMICREIKEKGIFGEVAAFLDDDTSKIGTKISGIPVIGPVMEIIPVLKHEAQDEALIAIPSAEKAYLSKLYTQLKKSGFHKIKILPGISQIIEGDARLVQAREIDPQDLLGRDPQIIGLKESIAYLRGKREPEVLSEVSLQDSCYPEVHSGYTSLVTVKIQFTRLNGN